MRQAYWENLNTSLYPSAFLHTFGVNGKISGSVGAIGEMSGKIIAVLHAPKGCGFHYRHSARRRHQPFYALLSTDLTENEIIMGGEDKLERTVREAYARYAPDLVFIIPSPISDVLNEDIEAVVRRLLAEGIKVAAAKSELFSHRDKNYAKTRVRELAKLKVNGGGQLELELKGCGFTEALYALVEQVMEPAEKIPYSVNIETIGWGNEGSETMHEIAAFLSRAGATVHCWIPSAPLEKLRTAPAASLNLVKRIRWARRMKELYGTDYLHMGDTGRYDGLDGIALFYTDIAERLGITDRMLPLIEAEKAQVLEATREDREYLAKKSGVLVCRGLQSAPTLLKRYAQECGLHLSAMVVILTADMRRGIDMDDALEAQLKGRMQDAIALYSPGTETCLNPDEETVRRLFAEADAVVGTSDYTMEGKGAPLISLAHNTLSVSFPSYVRNLRRLRERMETAAQRTRLILNRMPFTTEDYTLYPGKESAAAREMWRRMWLEKDREQR